MLLDDIRQPVDAVRVAERVQATSAAAFHIAGHELFATQSIGIAVCAEQHRTGQDVMRDADAAMYRAKRAGGGAYAVFDPAMHEAAVDLLRLETDLRHAVERHEFRLHYQAIVALDSGRPAGYEALVRWQHPVRGLLQPARLPAGGRGAGADRGDRRVGARRGVPPDPGVAAAAGRRRLWISANLSARSLGAPAIGERVAAATSARQASTPALHVEITESAAVSDPVLVRTVLRDLRGLGVQVSLDDFGTGYCSLSYLQQFPVDTLKIDRSFVQRIGEQGEGDGIVRLIVGLADTLKLAVVAEGVETALQAAHLSALGCQFGQGYHFARPVEPSAIAVDRAVPGEPHVDLVR